MANIYYVDPVKGSNDNDGSAPDKALVSPFKDGLDYGSYDDPAIFYFKRGTTFTVPKQAVTTTMILMSWPSSNDGEYWDNRPDGGKDWDDDDSARAIVHFNTDSYFDLQDDDSDIISFRNITLLNDDNKSNQPCINMKNSTAEFIDIKMSGELKHHVVYLRKVTSNVELPYTVKVVNSDIASKNQHDDFYNLADSSTYKFTKNILIQNSKFSGFSRVIANDRSSGWQTFWTNIQFINSTVDDCDYFAYFLDDACYGNPNGGVVNLLLQDSNIHTNSYCIRTGGEYDDRQVPSSLTINIKNTHMTADNNNPIFYFEADSDDCTHYTTINAVNSVFDGNNLIQKDDSANDGYFNYKFINNEFKNMNSVFYFRGSPHIKEFQLKNNKYTSCKGLIKTNTDNNLVKNLFVIESYVNLDYIISGNWNEGIISLSHSKINGNIVDYQNSILNMSLYDVECSNIITNGKIEANVCNIHQNGKFPVQAGYALVKNSKIDSPDYEIQTINTINTIFDKCDINSKFTLPTGYIGEMLILNSKVNDEDVPYTKLLPSQLRTVAAPHRVNGASYSLMIDNTNEMKDTGLNELEIPYDDAHTKVVVYFAALQNVLSGNYENEINVSFWKDNSIVSVPMTITTSDEDWDGLPDGYNKFEAGVDLGDQGLSKGDIVRTMISFSQINPEHFKIFIDPKMDNK